MPWVTIPLQETHPKITRHSDRRIAVRRVRKWLFFLTKSLIFRIFRKKKCGVVSPLFSKNLPLRKARKMEKMIVFGGVCFLKKQVKTGHFFFSEKSENVAISSKKKPLSDPQDSNSTVRLPRDFGVGLVQENRDPGHPQRAHFFHKNPLFCSIRTKIYVQNGQKPVFFSKRGVGLGGVFLEKSTPPFHEATQECTSWRAGAGLV